MQNYWIVLFKNKKKVKIIKKFVNYTKANSHFTNLIKNCDNVIFPVSYENGNEVEYEISIVDCQNKFNNPTFKTDILGRNIKVKLEDVGMNIIEIKNYKKEESIYDIKERKRISVTKFKQKYLSSKNLKVLSVLNNKILLQNELEIHLFSLKNESDAHRFLDCLGKHLSELKRNDVMLVKDDSTPQRKYLLNLLKTEGFDLKLLYRNYTTYPSRKE